MKRKLPTKPKPAKKYLPIDRHDLAVLCDLSATARDECLRQFKKFQAAIFLHDALTYQIEVESIQRILKELP